MIKILTFLLIQLIFTAPFDGMTLITSTTDREAFDGLTLITTIGGSQNTSSTFLIDNDENMINSWNHENGTASVAYLTQDSILFMPGKNTGNPGGGQGPQGGLFKKIDWDGNIIWEWQMPTEDICVPHHDIALLPNGNFLVICEETKTQQEALDAGLEGINGPITLDMVVEVQPIGIDNAEIVWEWHFWDHLVQERDPQYTATYGQIADHPELLDINVTGSGDNNGISDWNHCNKISYNAEFDQIVLSSRFMNEIYVVDHSTTTEEAAGHTGGNQGKGGDIIFRWGNPQNYGRGTADDQILNAQHGVDWIPDGYPGEGNFLLYNNRHQTGPNRSAILEFECIADENGYYHIDENEPFGPSDLVWVYQDDFFSNTQSGAYRLPNGNTIITVTNQQHIFEVNYNGEVEWEYSQNTQCARALKYGYDYFNSILTGDMNSDDQLNILDVVIIVQMILGNQATDLIGDINEDGGLNIQDIIILINIIIS